MCRMKLRTDGGRRAIGMFRLNPLDRNRIDDTSNPLPRPDPRSPPEQRPGVEGAERAAGKARAETINRDRRLTLEQSQDQLGYFAKREQKRPRKVDHIGILSRR